MISKHRIALALAILYDIYPDLFPEGEDFSDAMMHGAHRVPCSLCGLPTEFSALGADWYLCRLCESTEEACRRGFCHHDHHRTG